MTGENEINKLKVTEIKKELSFRNLSTNGLKKDLLARLEKALKEEKSSTIKEEEIEPVNSKSSTTKTNPFKKNKQTDFSKSQKSTKESDNDNDTSNENTATEAKKETPKKLDSPRNNKEKAKTTKSKSTKDKASPLSLKTGNENSQEKTSPLSKTKAKQTSNEKTSPLSKKGTKQDTKETVSNKKQTADESIPQNNEKTTAKDTQTKKTTQTPKKTKPNKKLQNTKNQESVAGTKNNSVAINDEKNVGNKQEAVSSESFQTPEASSLENNPQTSNNKDHAKSNPSIQEDLKATIKKQDQSFDEQKDSINHKKSDSVPMETVATKAQTKSSVVEPLVPTLSKSAVLPKEGHINNSKKEVDNNLAPKISKRDTVEQKNLGTKAQTNNEPLKDDNTSSIPMNTGIEFTHKKDTSNANDLQAAKETNTNLNTLLIQNLVRPLTHSQVEQLVKEYGNTSKIWINKIKSHCYCTYEESQDAIQAMRILDGIVFPVESGKQISVSIIEDIHANDLISREELAQEREEKCYLEKINDHEYDLKIKEIPEPSVEAANGKKQKRKMEDDAVENNHVEVVHLDDLFKKTESKPLLYYTFAKEYSGSQNQNKRQKQA